MVYAVYCGRQFTGIIETNFRWAAEYWQQRSNATGKKFTLRQLEPIT